MKLLIYNIHHGAHGTSACTVIVIPIGIPANIRVVLFAVLLLKLNMLKDGYIYNAMWKASSSYHFLDFQIIVAYVLSARCKAW